MSKKNLIIILVVVVVLIIVAVVFLKGGYGSKTSYSTPQTGTQASQQPAAKNQVTIENNSFNPMQISVKVGDTVTWTNNDSYNHTVKSADGLFDSGNIASGSNFSFTFAKAGTFKYTCSIHPFMQGTVVVAQ